jgi:hypothetical protein
MGAQTSEEEVKIARHGGEAPQSGGWARLLLPERASDLAQGDCANELGLPSRKTARKIAAPLARKDGSHPMHRVTKESWPAKSADRSIAQRAPATAPATM